MNSSIFKRLAVLQAIVDRQRPARVVIHFTNGTATVTTPGGAIDILRAHGVHGEVDSFQSDNPVYSGWARLLTGSTPRQIAQSRILSGNIPAQSRGKGKIT